MATDNAAPAENESTIRKDIAVTLSPEDIILFDGMNLTVHCSVLNVTYLIKEGSMTSVYISEDYTENKPSKTSSKGRKRR